MHVLLFMCIQFELGMKAVCTAYNTYLHFTFVLTGNNTDQDESDDEYINDISNQYILQRVMESACRWVIIN